MSDDNPKPSALDDLPTPGLFGEEAITAEILAMLCKRDGKGGGELDSGGIPITADLMTLCEEQGCIEITGKSGASIFATVAPEGRALLEQLRAEQERERQRMDKTLRRMRRDEAGNEPDE